MHYGNVISGEGLWGADCPKWSSSQGLILVSIPESSVNLLVNGKHRLLG